MSRSAKPLFRAMHRKVGAAVGQSEMSGMPSGRRAASDTRREHDAYMTGEPDAIRALLSRDGERIMACGSVWDPACGSGHMVAEIRSAGIPCCASDLISRGCPDSWVADYFTCLRSRARAIITNPPYNLINARDGKGAWLRHTLEIPGWDYLALLLSWDWPAARMNGLADLLDARPFSYCYLMRWKIDFTGEGSPPQRNAWFVWDLNDQRATDGGASEPGFRFLDRVDHRQGVLI